MRELPKFKEFTIDIRLKQFRKVWKNNIVFIDFKTYEGDILLSEYIKSLDSNSKEFKEILDLF